jgi:hypothetical protein
MSPFQLSKTVNVKYTIKPASVCYSERTGSRVSKNRVLWQIFGRERENVGGGGGLGKTAQ